MYNQRIYAMYQRYITLAHNRYWAHHRNPTPAALAAYNIAYQHMRRFEMLYNVE